MGAFRFRARLRATVLAITLLSLAASALSAQTAVTADARNLTLWDGSYENDGFLEFSLYREGEALDRARTLGDDRGTMALLNEIGIDYISWRRYDLAEKSFTEAMTIARKIKDENALVSATTNLAHLFHETGDYGKALQLYRENLAAHEKEGQAREIAERRYDIARLYTAWGQYDEAMKQFVALGSEAHRLDNESLVFRVEDAIIETFILQGKPVKALEACVELTSLVERKQWTGRFAPVYTRNAEILILLGRNEEALPLLRKALKTNGKYGTENDSLEIIQKLSRAYRALARYAEAIDYADMALLMAKESGRVSIQAELMTDLGRNYSSLKKYPEAVRYLRDSVAIKERLRLTATGATRRDYLASQIQTYDYLAEAYLLDGNTAEAFNTKELSRAKYMAEQMATKSADSTVGFPGIDAFRKTLDPRTLVISFSVPDEGLLTILLADARNLAGFRIDTAPVLAGILSKTKNRAIAPDASPANRGLVINTGKRPDGGPPAGEGPGKPDLDRIIAYYRSLLIQPETRARGLTVASAKPANTASADFDAIGRSLHDLLIGPALPMLQGKERILVIPEGSLGLVPFETLITPDGSYLVEKFDISYTQSLTVTALIDRRASGEIKRPKEMLAFGGAVYDERTWNDTMEDAVLTAPQAYALLDRGAAADAYRSLGYSWANLPGTLVEAAEIGRLVNGAVIISRENVEEGNIKALSIKGELRKYRVIHFATHGLVVPEVPELSALVLSQFRERRNGEDGYLTMGEILSLDIAADFVNLSACETGLGKIYKGEGVVGLTQSFIVAGANGVSVSLWSVADESTKDFMVGMYALVKETGCSWRQAITQMKRKFISSAAYPSPYFWAPFVFYGR